jgi:hypothetical protein
MNQNDMERYFWRTGQRWNGDRQAFMKPSRRRKAVNETILFLFVALAVTTVLLLLIRYATVFLSS